MSKKICITITEFNKAYSEVAVIESPIHLALQVFLFNHNREYAEYKIANIILNRERVPGRGRGCDKIPETLAKVVMYPKRKPERHIQLTQQRLSDVFSEVASTSSPLFRKLDRELFPLEEIK